MVAGKGMASPAVPLASLVVANLATIVLALLQDWDIGTVIFIYWFQSIVIGIFTATTVLIIPPASLPGNRTQIWGGGLIPDLARRAFPNPGPSLAKGIAAGVFLFFYGFVHWILFAGLANFGLFRDVHPLADSDILIACSLFVANHLYSFLVYWHERAASLSVIKDLGAEGFRRVLPMQLTGAFAGIALQYNFLGMSLWPLVLPFFMFVKTCIDVKAHLRKHRRVIQERGPADGA